TGPEFDRDIKPLFAMTCFARHNTPSKLSGFSLESIESVLQGGAINGPAIIPGKAAESPLIQYLRGEKKPGMPLNRPPLPGDQIAMIWHWIDQLPPRAPASLPAHKASWPFTPLGTPAVPGVRQRDWMRNPIDAFILAKLEEK